ALEGEIWKEVLDRARKFQAGDVDVPSDAFATDVTGVVWAFNFAGMLDRGFYGQVRDVILQIGRVLDRQRPPGPGTGRVAAGFTAVGVPHVELDLPDRFVVHKPPGWEVDTADVGGARHMSQFLQS
ncbi:unnamed protein product, partial [Polarella glacialis]